MYTSIFICVFQSTAAGALGSAANKADSLATDADLSIVSGMATSTYTSCLCLILRKCT